MTERREQSWVGGLANVQASRELRAALASSGARWLWTVWTKLTLAVLALAATVTAQQPRQFSIWLLADPHLLADKAHPGDSTYEPTGRESLAKAIRHSLGVTSPDRFSFDVALMLGDASKELDQPTPAEGQEYVRQVGAGVAAGIARERFYPLAGNHDAGPGQAWFLRWMDPFGTNPYESQRNPANFPFPIVAGQPLAYRVDMGNITVLMLSDRNELGAPAGRQGVSSFGGGGRPAGAITEETFLWWKAQVTQAKAEGRIVLTAAHHVLRETTAWSGDYGGQKLVNGQWTGWIHGYDPAGVDNEGASYLYWFVHPDGSATPKALAFETYLAANSGATDLWIGAHSHSDPRVPDAAGRTHLETRWGTHFIQAAGLTRYHVDTSYPRSVLLTFTEGSTTVLVRPYWHSTRAGAVGWDTERQRTLTLATPFVYPVGYDGPGSVVNPSPCATPAPTPTATPSACPTPTPSPDSIPPAV